MTLDQIRPNLVPRGSVFPEPVLIVTATPVGKSIRIIGIGQRTNQAYQPILTEDQLAHLGVENGAEISSAFGRTGHTFVTARWKKGDSRT
jgi:hypothetical protein